VSCHTHTERERIIEERMDHDADYAEGLRRMSKLVNFLLARADCGPFREPVDWRGLELYDYPKIIKKMMDLGTVKRKLERNQYKNASECADDIRLIWKNCKTYNADGSDYYLLAETFSRRFEDRYKKIRNEFDTGDNHDKGSSSHVSSSAASNHSTSKSSNGAASSDNNGTNNSKHSPNLELRTQFGSSLYRLSGIELGHVIQVLDLRCPHALETPCAASACDALNNGKRKRTVEDEADIEIDVDLIDSQTFAQLDRYVREKVSLNGRGSGSGGSGGDKEDGGEYVGGSHTKKRKK